MRCTLWLAFASTIAAAPLAAQGATLIGGVRRDTLETAIPGAEISIPELKINLRANYLGDFRLDRLRPGKFLIQIRTIGFEPLQDTVELIAGQTTTLDFIMTPQIAKLDSVVITAPERKYVSPTLRAFEGRRKEGVGRFVSEEELRKNENHALGDIIAARAPGLKVVRSGSSSYLATTRNASGGCAAFQGCPGGGRNTPCWVSVYIDGLLIYDKGKPSGPPPDFERLRVADYAGVEYYPGGASVPAQYNATGSGCGVLLLWTRER